MVGLILASAALTACDRSPTDDLIARSVTHLEAAAGLLEKSAPNPVALALSVMDYRHEHRAELRKLRADGDAVLATLDEAGRKKLGEDSRARTLTVITRIENLVKRYPKPRAARVAIQPLVMQATPRPHKGKVNPRPWAPPLPPRPHSHDETPAPAPETVTPAL